MCIVPHFSVEMDWQPCHMLACCHNFVRECFWTLNVIPSYILWVWIQTVCWSIIISTTMYYILVIWFCDKSNILCQFLHFPRFDVQSYWLNKLSFSLIINIAHTLLKIAISINLLQNLQPNHIPDTTTMGNSWTSLDERRLEQCNHLLTKARKCKYMHF